MQWKDFTHQPQINKTSSLFCTLWEAGSWEVRNNEELLLAPTSGYPKHAGSYSMEIWISKVWSRVEQVPGNEEIPKGTTGPNPNGSIRKQIRHGWWPGAKVQRAVRSAHAALITVLNSRAQKTPDTEDTEERAKPPERYDVKNHFQTTQAHSYTYGGHLESSNLKESQGVRVDRMKHMVYSEKKGLCGFRQHI